ncbi:unnamed protein product [Miscanthus lutarioriparius]|uniref:Cytochrome b561 domain-containing protein n=1 Tax=Miscanthus lutarioriparius TaxID=422564 RepID=A0A811NWM4_9POAL|nr:unnamed protein product [Miscanthus lutarioriparius]
MARTMRAPKHVVQRCTPLPLFSVFLIALCFAASNLPPRELGGLVQQRPQPWQTRRLQHHRPHLLPSMALAGLRPKSTLRLSVVGAYRIFGKAAPGSNAWSFVLSAPDNGGYISIGFSPTGRMVGSSAVAGSCPPDQGKLALASGAAAPTVVSNGSRLYLAFQLAGQPLTDVVYAVGPSGTLPGRTGCCRSTRTWRPAPSACPAAPVAGQPCYRRRSSGGAFLSAARRHGVLALVSWGVLVPAGVALARFFKRFDPFWFYAHVVAQGLGFLLGVLAVVAGFRLDDDEGPIATHKAIGVAVLVCACLQVMAVLARPAKETKARRYWNWYHHSVGRAAVVLGVANIFYGLSLANERQEWSYVYGIFIGDKADAVLDRAGTLRLRVRVAAARRLLRSSRSSVIIEHKAAPWVGEIWIVGQHAGAEGREVVLPQMRQRDPRAAVVRVEQVLSIALARMVAIRALVCV